MSSILGLVGSGCFGDSDSLLTVIFLTLEGSSSSLLNLLLPMGDPGDISKTFVKLKVGSFPKYSTDTRIEFVTLLFNIKFQISMAQKYFSP